MTRRVWWMSLLRFARPAWRGVLMLLAIMLAAVAFDVLKPWPLKLIVDGVLAGEPLPEAAAWVETLPGAGSGAGLLGWLAAATVALFLFHKAAQIGHKYIEAGVGATLSYALGGALFDHLQRLSLRFHGRRATGDLVRRVTQDNACVRELVFDVVLLVLTPLVTLLTMFAILWKLDAALAGVAIAAAPLLALIIRWFARPMTERKFEEKEAQGRIMTLAERALAALPVIQAYGREAHFDQQFGRHASEVIHANLRARTAELHFTVSASAVTAVGTALIMVLGGFHVLEGRLTVGGLLVFLSYLSSLYAPLETLAFVSTSLASSAAGARRVLAILDEDDVITDAPHARALPARPQGRVSFESVTFGYEPGDAVLRDLSLDVSPGETIALVGPTGAGKSTLVSLIPRFFDPWSGRVALDGHDLRDLRLSSLRRAVSIVLQDAFLLPMSVAENIAYGREDADRRAIVAAAEAAGADAFIRGLPDGYDTVIGERGATLSGGQRQAIAIARALLKDAPVLILDEPTSALDPATEAGLLDALAVLTRGRTTFVIAHRLSTVRNADRIVVLDRGRIVECGHPAELLAGAGEYRRMFELQAGPDESGRPPLAPRAGAAP